MDERTRRTDDEATPDIRAVPLPATKSKTGRRRLIVGVVVVIVLAALGYLVYRSLAANPSASGGRAGPAGAAQSVGAATIGKGDIRVLVNALGTVTPIATVTVQTQIDGQLTEVAYTEGQMVKKGDFLAQIDPRPYQLLLAQYEGQLARDQGILAQARVDLARYQKLAEQNSIARQQYEDQIYIVQQDEGTVKLDQAQIDQQKLNVVYCHIVSPVTGRIGLRLIDPGNYVQTSNSTGLAVVTQMQPITVIFPIPEDNLPDVMPPMAAGTELEVFAFDRSNQKMLAVGRVAALDSQIDTTTGTVKIRAQFDNPDNALFPNQFVNAQLLVRTLKDTVVVPTAAIQRGAPGNYVYIINKDSTVSVRSINIGPSDGPMAAVTSGLAVGDQVVVDGTDRLRDGARVFVPGSKQRGSAPGTGGSATTGQSNTNASPTNSAPQNNTNGSQNNNAPQNNTNGSQRQNNGGSQ